jgi:hypothetical protein
MQHAEKAWMAVSSTAMTRGLKRAKPVPQFKEVFWFAGGQPFFKKEPLAYLYANKGDQLGSLALVGVGVVRSLKPSMPIVTNPESWPPVSR